MEQDVREKAKAGLRRSSNFKKDLELPLADDGDGGLDRNGASSRRPIPLKQKSSSSSATTAPSLSSSSLSASTPSISESVKRRANCSSDASQPTKAGSSDGHELRTRNKGLAADEDGPHNGTAKATTTNVDLKRSGRSTSQSLQQQAQLAKPRGGGAAAAAALPSSSAPASKEKVSKDKPMLLEEEDSDDDDLVIEIRRPHLVSQQASGGGSTKGKPGGKSAGGDDGRRRSLDAGSTAQMAKTEPVRRRQMTDAARNPNARLDVRKRASTSNESPSQRGATGIRGGGSSATNSPSQGRPTVGLKEGSHSARESTARQVLLGAGDDDSSSGNRRDRREGPQDLKKTLSTGSILTRSNMEKEGGTSSSAGGSTPAGATKASGSSGKQTKSNRDLKKLTPTAEEKSSTDRRKLGSSVADGSPATRTARKRAPQPVSVSKKEKKDDGDARDRPASPTSGRSSRREDAEQTAEEGSASSESRRGLSKSRPDSARDKRERREPKDGDEPTPEPRKSSSRPTSARIAKTGDVSVRKEKRQEEDNGAGGEDDDSSLLTSSEDTTPRRRSRTLSPVEDEDDEDSTASFTTPRDQSSASSASNGGRSSRRASMKVRENGATTDDPRKRGSNHSRRRSMRNSTSLSARERGESEEDGDKDSKTEEEERDDGDEQLSDDEEESDQEELDGATIDYNARLRKFILSCVEDLMKTVTRWAVAVSTPTPMAGELRVVDITRYANGTLAILDGLKMGRAQRSTSGRDLSSSKVEKSAQSSVHVTVNILLQKLLKIKNRINNLSSKSLPLFYQAFYAVRSFHETGEAVRNTSSIHLPLKSTLSASSIDTTLVAAQFPDCTAPTPSPRPSPFELSGTDQTEYMQEPMKCRIGSSGLKSRTLVLQRSNLLVFPKNRSKCKDDKPLKVHDLRNTKLVSPAYVNKNATKIKPQSFCVQTMEDEEIEIEATSKEIMAAWVLALDGLCMPNYSTHLNAQFRSELLQHAGKNVYKGGVIKSSYEEEWSYFANGTLERAEPLNGRRLTYTWDGEVLQPLRAKGTDDDGGPSLGTGRWNGVWLSWYRGDYLSEDPVIQYFWLPTEREFQTSNPLLAWKWTRHFLACKYGSGEWIMEGEVPSPVVMCLQLMRYAAAIRAEELSRQLTAAPSFLTSSPMSPKS